MVSVSYPSVLGLLEDISRDILFGIHFSGYLGTTCLRIYKFLQFQLFFREFRKSLLKVL